MSKGKSCVKSRLGVLAEKKLQFLQNDTYSRLNRREGESMKQFLSMLILVLLFPSFAGARVIGGGQLMDQEMEENLCALTFDDGPSIFTPKLLDQLREYGIPATFFMLGQMAEHYPDIVRRVADEGHEIALHTYSHKNLKRLSYLGQVNEIERGYMSLVNHGIVPSYLRPPYGSYDERTKQICDDLGMHVVLWSVDSRDWKRLPDDYTKLPSVRGAFAEGAMRGVFLFHDIHETTVLDLPRIVQQLRQAGCERFVTLSSYLEGILDPEPPLLMSRRTQKKEIEENPAVMVQVESNSSNHNAAQVPLFEEVQDDLSMGLFDGKKEERLHF